MSNDSKVQKLVVPPPPPDAKTTASADNTTPSQKAAYQDLFERSIDAILLVDISNGKIQESNDSAERIFEISKQELNQMTLVDFCFPEYLQEYQKMIRIASRRYHPKLFELPLNVGTAPNRKSIVVEMALSPLKLKDGSEVLQCLFRDITELKEKERENAEYLKQIEAMATTDGMTGLTNFRQFTKMLEAEHMRAMRYKSKYSIVFCDIDHFKKYNDRNGHPAGDALLKDFANIFRAAVRTTDTPARYGGEEFVVILPETDIKGASIIAERIREKVAATKFQHAEGQPMGFVSISVGVSSYPQDGNDPKQVLKVADEMLYQSKHNGRNRVTVSQGPTAPIIHHQN